MGSNTAIRIETGILLQARLILAINDPQKALSAKVPRYGL